MSGKFIVLGTTFCPFTKELCNDKCAMYILGEGCLISNAMASLSDITKPQKK